MTVPGQPILEGRSSRSKSWSAGGRPIWLEREVATRIKVPHTFIVHNYKRPTMCQWCRRLLRGLFRQGVQCKGKPALLFQRLKIIQFSWFSLYSFVFCEPTKSCRSSQWQYMCIVTYSNSVSLCKLVNELAWFITFLSTFINQTHFA